MKKYKYRHIENVKTGSKNDYVTLMIVMFYVGSVFVVESYKPFCIYIII